MQEGIEYRICHLEFFYENKRVQNYQEIFYSVKIPFVEFVFLLSIFLVLI